MSGSQSPQSREALLAVPYIETAHLGKHMNHYREPANTTAEYPVQLKTEKNHGSYSHSKDKILSDKSGLSVVLCVRHTMLTERNMYAESSQEDAESERRRP